MWALSRGHARELSYFLMNYKIVQLKRVKNYLF